MTLLSDEAAPLVAAAEGSEPLEAWKCSGAVKILETEFNSLSRLGLGALSLVLLTIGGFALGGAFDSFDGEPGLAILSLVIAAVMIVGGAWLGRRVVVAGARVVAAYRAWSGADPTNVVELWSIYRRALSGRGLLRSALNAAAFIAAFFGWTFLFLGLAPSDPADLGSSQTAMIGIGLVWGVAFTIAAGCLLAGEIKVGRANSAAVIRTRR